MMADDEPTLRTTLARMLRRHGYDVTVAEDGAELLARYDDAALRRWPNLAATLVGYVALTQAVKSWLMRRGWI